MEKFWTDAKIAESIEKNKGRVQKSSTQKRPRQFMSPESLSKLVSERNGFMKDNVREVIDDFLAIIHEQILLGKRVSLPRLGSFYLTITGPQRKNLKLTGLGGVAKDHYIAPRWRFTFYRNEEANFLLKSREVTEEELETIYVDEK